MQKDTSVKSLLSEIEAVKQCQAELRNGILALQGISENSKADIKQKMREISCANEDPTYSMNFASNLLAKYQEIMEHAISCITIKWPPDISGK